MTASSSSTTRLPQDNIEIYKNKSLETIRFPFNSFRYSLTLFSKFFSSFPHGTCSLSVSHLYLALDGIYHLLWTAFPSNPTLWKQIVRKPFTGRDGSITLYAALFQGTWPVKRRWQCFNRLQFAIGNPYRDFKLELIPLHSPLLGESLLVSFPPLSYMLKFSG